jgi:hypothetical protein
MVQIILSIAPWIYSKKIIGVISIPAVKEGRRCRDNEKARSKELHVR